MKLLISAIAYLSAVCVVVLAAFIGLWSIEPRQEVPSPVLASSANDETPQRPVAAIQDDPDRVPVWIAPTAKYEYTPVPIDRTPKRPPVIGAEAQAAMARSQSRTDGRRAIDRAFGQTDRGPGHALGFARSRDNDPFHRD